MYDRDYILRMVREFASFLARLVRTKDGDGDVRTLADLDQAALTFVGLGLGALETLPGEQLTMLFSLDGTLDVNRAYAAGRLLEERARIASERENAELAAAVGAKALQLLVDAALTFSSYLNEEHRSTLHRLSDRLLVAASGLTPRLLCGILEVHLRQGEAARIRHIAALLSERATEPLDPMTALRIALRGQCALLLGRLEPLLAAGTDDGRAGEAPAG